MESLLIKVEPKQPTVLLVDLDSAFNAVGEEELASQLMLLAPDINKKPKGLQMFASSSSVFYEVKTGTPGPSGLMQQETIEDGWMSWCALAGLTISDKLIFRCARKKCHASGLMADHVG